MVSLKKIMAAVICLMFALGSYSVGNITVSANEQTPSTIKIDTTYISQAVVGNTLYELNSDIRNSKRQRLYEFSASYEIIAGQDVAEIVNENSLKVKKAGHFTLKAKVIGAESVFEEVQGTAINLTFSDVKLSNDFKDITVYTQPIYLVGSVTVSGVEFIEEYLKELVFEVVSGSAEIYSGRYLRFTGAGEVVVSVASYFDREIAKTYTIYVADPDAGNINTGKTFAQGDLEAKNSSLLPIILSVVVGGLAIAVTVFFVIKRKRKI